MQAVDEAVERLWRILERRGLADTTYFIVTSDNGFHLGQHRLPFGKGTAYEEDVHVPLYVRGPGVRVDEKEARLTVMRRPAGDPRRPRGRVAAGASTAARCGRSGSPRSERAVAAAGADRELRGRRRRGGARRRPAEDEPQTQAIRRRSSAACAAPRTKYVELLGGDQAELYDLDDDPHELDNLGALPDAGVAARSSPTCLHAMAACRAKTAAHRGARLPARDDEAGLLAASSREPPSSVIAGPAEREAISTSHHQTA